MIAQSITYDGDAKHVEKLSEREREVLGMIGRGLNSEEIAAAIFRSVKVVEYVRSKINEKLNVKHRVKLARIAIAAGLSPTPILRNNQKEIGHE